MTQTREQQRFVNDWNQPIESVSGDPARLLMAGRICHDGQTHVVVIHDVANENETIYTVNQFGFRNGKLTVRNVSPYSSESTPAEGAAFVPSPANPVEGVTLRQHVRKPWLHNRLIDVDGVFTGWEIAASGFAGVHTQDDQAEWADANENRDYMHVGKLAAVRDASRAERSAPAPAEAVERVESVTDRMTSNGGREIKIYNVDTAPNQPECWASYGEYGVRVRFDGDLYNTEQRRLPVWANVPNQWPLPAAAIEALSTWADSLPPAAPESAPVGERMPYDAASFPPGIVPTRHRLDSDVPLVQGRPVSHRRCPIQLRAARGCVDWLERTRKGMGVVD